jgi:hypothetical protein
MRKRLSFVLLAVAVATLVLGVGQASAWQKDPDTTVDPASLTTVITQLLAPAVTVGDDDTTAAGTAGVAVGVTEAPTMAGPSPGAIFVDDNLLDCPNAQSTSIQAAVNASGPNATVKVCPGTYSEQVRIVGHAHDGLKLESLKPLQAVIKWPAVESFPLALVDFNTVDHVTLRGFTVSGPFTFGGCSPDRHEGLLVENGFDERILHNHITLIRNSLPALYGCQEGDAVAIGRRTDPTKVGFVGTAPGSAHIWQNTIDEYQKNGVQAVNNGSFADLDHNEITGSDAVQFITASNGVAVFRQAGATVEHNVISNHHYTPFPLSTGVILDEAPPGSSKVDHNRIFDNDFGIESDTQNNLEISHNDVFKNLSDAITLCGEVGFGCGPATGIIVRSNDITDNGGSGLALFGADANLLKSNHIERNGAPGDLTDGIRVDTLSSGNQILDNHLLANLTHDCHDDSTGGGTAGTANFWKGNKGATDNKAGQLCVNN